MRAWTGVESGVACQLHLAVRSPDSTNMRACQSFGGGPAERVGVTLYTHCADGARLLCGDAPRGAMLGAPLVATTSEGRTMLVGVLSSDATAGGVSDTPLALRFADVGAAHAWILAASGLIRANRFSFIF